MLPIVIIGRLFEIRRSKILCSERSGSSRDKPIRSQKAGAYAESSSSRQ